MKEEKLHITDLEMQGYVQNKLSQVDRQRVELEIQLCDACLERFIHWTSVEVPQYLPSAEQAAEHIIFTIEAEQKPKKHRWIQRPLAQVAVAASITVLLVGTGVIGAISSSMVQLEQGIEQPLTEQSDQNLIPQSERWLDKATQWLHQIQERRFE